MFLHEAVEHNIGRERHWGQAHSAQFVIPISDFLRGESNTGILHVVQTGRNILNLDCLGFKRSQLDEVVLEGELLRIGVYYLDCSP
jgi:hypothetical protein